jgi:hypothetical protein
MAVASAASAAQSAKTGGMSLSLMIDAQVSESSHQEWETTNKASNLVARSGDVNLTAEKIQQTGSNVISQNGDINYDANKVTIEASRDSLRTKDKQDTYSANITVGTGGVSGSLNFSLDSANSSAVNYNNSTLQAANGTVNIGKGKGKGDKMGKADEVKVGHRDGGTDHFFLREVKKRTNEKTFRSYIFNIFNKKILKVSLRRIQVANATVESKTS